MRGESIAFSKHCVVWDSLRKKRLGYFKNNCVFNDEEQVLGILRGNTVRSPDQTILGTVCEREDSDEILYQLELSINGKLVGHVFGDAQPHYCFILGSTARDVPTILIHHRVGSLPVRDLAFTVAAVSFAFVRQFRAMWSGRPQSYQLPLLSPFLPPPLLLSSG